MRAVIIYSSRGGLDAIVEGLHAGLEQSSFQVQRIQADDRSGNVVPVASYDLVLVGCPVMGAFGGQVPGDIDATLRRVTRLDGKTTAAFVKPKLFGSRKSLTRLMGLLERQGAWVQDFATLRGRDDAMQFALRMEELVKNRP